MTTKKKRRQQRPLAKLERIKRRGKLQRLAATITRARDRQLELDAKRAQLEDAGVIPVEVEELDNDEQPDDAVDALSDTPREELEASQDTRDS